MPAAAAISCSRSPSGPLRAISSCAVSRISRRASSGVRRSRFIEARIGDHKHVLTLLSATHILKQSHPQWDEIHVATHRYPPASDRRLSRGLQADAEPRGYAAGVLVD